MNCRFRLARSCTYLGPDRPRPRRRREGTQTNDRPPEALWNSQHRLASALKLKSTPSTNSLSHKIAIRRKLRCVYAIIPLVWFRLETVRTIRLSHSFRSRQATFNSLRLAERCLRRGGRLDALKSPDSARDRSCLRPPELTQLHVLRLANDDMEDIPDSQGQRGYEAASTGRHR